MQHTLGGLSTEQRFPGDVGESVLLKSLKVEVLVLIS